MKLVLGGEMKKETILFGRGRVGKRCQRGGVREGLKFYSSDLR